MKNKANIILHEKKEFRDIKALIEWAAENYSDDIAFSFKTKPLDKKTVKISFKKLRDDVRALSSKLISMGIGGKHCVVIGKLSYDWVLLYYSVFCSGGVLVPLDKDWGADELKDTAISADMDMLFCDIELKEKADIVSCGKLTPVYFNTAADGSLSSLLNEGRKSSQAEYFDIQSDPYKMSLLVFTSGTTGKGKGVMLSQNAILSDVSSAFPYIDYSKKTISVLPPHHTYGSTIMLTAHTMIGCEVYLSSGIKYITKELKEQAPGHMVLVPLYLETFYRRIWANIKEQKKERLVKSMIWLCDSLHLSTKVRRRLFSSIHSVFGGKLEMIVSGGAPINRDILRFFKSIGIEVLNGYGITECAPLIAFNRSLNVVEGSVGNVIDIDTVKISSPDENNEGEILVKGPNVMLGYYKDERATDEAFCDGYFKTGDYGRLEDGVLFITGRKKNLIILSNGKNVYPEEIENSLASEEGILDVVVYEGQSRRGISYNAIVAEIFPDMEYFEKNGIKNIYEHIKNYVDQYNKTATPYKKIALLKLRDTDFPKNTLRKIMRFKIDMTID